MEEYTQIYNQMGDPDRARTYVMELIEIRGGWASAPDATPEAKSAYSRLLLECEPADLRDPQMALRYAREAVDQSESPSAELYRTLALAHQRNGDSRQAAEFQRRALEALPEGHAETRSSLEAELERYESQVADNDL